MQALSPHTAPLFVSAVRMLPAGLALILWGIKDNRPQPKTSTAWLWIAAFGLADAACFQVVTENIPGKYMCNETESSMRKDENSHGVSTTPKGIQNFEMLARGQPFIMTKPLKSLCSPSIQFSCSPFADIDSSNIDSDKKGP